MHLSLLSRARTEPAIITTDRTYSVQDVVTVAQAVRDTCLAIPTAGQARVLVPARDPVNFLGGVLGCWLASVTAVPWRLSGDTSDDAGVDDVTGNVVGANGHLHFDAERQPQLVPRERFHHVYPHTADLVLTTTGSTGAPKGVCLTAEQIILNSTLAGDAISLGDLDRWAIDIDLALTSGICHLLMAWLANRPLHYLRDANWDQKKAYFALGNAGFGGSPIQLMQIADRIEQDCAPHALMSSGDFLTAPMVGHIRNRFPETSIYRFYGLTELSGRFCCMPAHLLDTMPEATGVPLPGFAAEIRDEEGRTVGPHEPGEIFARSPLLTRGYLRSPDVFEAVGDDGWFATGDLGTIDELGIISLAGRANDSFKVGGEKVDRITIENALARTLQGIEYCVLPKAHPMLGFCAALYVVADDSRCPPWRDIVGSLSKTLPSRYVPMYGYAVPYIPRGGAGKIDREALISLGETAPRIA